MTLVTRVFVYVGTAVQDSYTSVEWAVEGGGGEGGEREVKERTYMRKLILYDIFHVTCYTYDLFNYVFQSLGMGLEDMLYT